MYVHIKIIYHFYASKRQYQNHWVIDNYLSVVKVFDLRKHKEMFMLNAYLRFIGYLNNLIILL